MPKNKDPTADLQAAVEKLEAFTQQNNASGNVSLQKTIDLMRAFFAATFSEKKREEQVQQRQEKYADLLHAIDVLKSNYLLIDRLKMGTPQQQKLAASALAAIERYNAFIDLAKKKPSSLGEHIASFLAEHGGDVRVENLAKIHMPYQATIELKFSEPGRKAGNQPKHYTSRNLSPYVIASSHKVGSLTQLVVPLAPLTPHHNLYLSKQAVELFHMKAIALIEKHGILSNVEARSAVRKTPLHVMLDPARPDICQATCALTPFPGQTIAIKGSFAKDLRTQEYTCPNADSFILTFTSTQTGYPHPLQHTGWALPDLLPVYPHHLDELPLFRLLYQHKHEMGRTLNPEGPFLLKAKEILRLKRHAFDYAKEHFIDRHRLLIIGLMTAAQADAQAIYAAEQFFQRLKPVYHGYDYLADTHHLVHGLFIIRPFEKLQTAWMERKIPAFQGPDFQLRYRTALQFMANEAQFAQEELTRQRQSAASDLEKCTIDFMQGLGTILSTPLHNILLQSFSESAAFAPPMLNDFELKLQLILFKQLKAFLTDFSLELTDDDIRNNALILQKMDHCLLAETDILNAESYETLEAKDPDAQLPNELEAYYNSRYHSQR